jgi:Ala-tRNA(Pro) deacylase
MPATMDDLLHRLDDLGIKATTQRHAAVFTVEEAKAERGDLAGGHCKCLFLKDKKGALWLVVALEDRKMDLKALRHQIGAAALSFGRPERLLEVLGVTPGSVTPFALINDGARLVNVVLDREMMELDLVNYHPLTNQATTTLSPGDLLAFIEACGHQPQMVAL